MVERFSENPEAGGDGERDDLRGGEMREITAPVGRSPRDVQMEREAADSGITAPASDVVASFPVAEEIEGVGSPDGVEYTLIHGDPLDRTQKVEELKAAAQAARDVAFAKTRALVEAFGERQQAPAETLAEPSEETRAGFTQTTERLAQKDGSKLSGRDYWLGTSIGLVALCGDEQNPGCSLRVAIHEIDASPFEAPTVTYELADAPESDPVGSVTHSEDMAEGIPSDAQMRAFTDAAEAISEAAKRQQALDETRPVEVEVCNTTVDNYTSDDVEAYLAANPTILARNDVTPHEDTGRPGHWVRVGQAVDFFRTARPTTVDETFRLLDVAEEEHAELENLGAVVPRTAQFVLLQAEYDPVVCVVSEHIDAPPLRKPEAVTTQEEADEHLRAISIVFEYIEGNDELYLEDIAKYTQWGKGGVLFDIEPSVASCDNPGRDAEIMGLHAWLEQLPQSPRRDELLGQVGFFYNVTELERRQRRRLMQSPEETWDE